MELRGGQEKRSIGGIITSSSTVYNNNPSFREQSSFSTTTLISPTSGGSGERSRRDNTNNNNGSTSTDQFNNPSQTLDHNHHDPLDPIPVSIAVVHDTPPTASSPVAGGGGSTTPPPAKTISSTIIMSSTIRFRECLKNHAANIGGHVVDGCGEFMPSGEEGTREALKCAACNCHRNFHRKEVDGEFQSVGPNCYYCYNPNNMNDRGSRRIQHHPHPLTTPRTATTTLLPTPLQQHHLQSNYQLGLPTSPPIQPMMMAFGGGGGGTESSSEEHNMFKSGGGGGLVGQSSHHHHQPSFGSSKKRFRTKFSQDQKDKMLEFAEKIGWRIQKQDEQEVQQFCIEVGIKRQVLKVWMHNNKHTMKKKEEL